MIKRLVTGLLLACSINLAWAFEISDVRIEGLKRVSPERVLSTLPISAGQTYTPSAGAQTIRALFGLGFFRDIDLRRDGNDLVIELVERPAIARVVFNGNKLIPDEGLREVLRDAGLSEGEVLLQSTLDRLRTQLAREYEGQGRYDATVQAQVVELPDNRVGIEIDINEGQVATIDRIRFIGAHQIPADDLLDEMELTEPGALTFFTKSHRFNQQRLNGDIERIRSLYFDRGFAQADVQPATVQLDPVTQSVFLTIVINEGRQFTVSDVRVAGDLPPGVEDLNEVVQLASGDLYRQRAVSEDSERLRDVIGRQASPTPTCVRYPSLI